MEVSKKFIFEKLTPTADNELGIYENALNFVFENEDIRNVAMSGAFGAGKSSVLESYKSIHKDIKFVHISLAHFSDETKQDSPISLKESVLEGKILNQLIHQIPADRIPQTNFRVKRRISRPRLILTSFAVLIAVMCFLGIRFFESWIKLVDSLRTSFFKTVLELTCTPEAKLLMGLVFLFVVFLFLLKFIRSQLNKNIFKKLNIKGNEIEIFEDDNDSYFDKYLNEVLYLFENVDADVIVFEDMDRFEANQIFERLREVNTLSNLQRKKDGHDTIRFFYLLKDDIFTSKDRTKFFDYIIPVVPIVDSSNSYDQFIAHLKKNNLFAHFDERFLQGLSLYVDDMRLLKNICNEFLVYYYRLNTTELDYNKMMALMVYKNLFPRDYSDLQLNKGFVYALFQKREDFIKKELEKKQNELNEKQNLIESIKREHIKSIAELDLITKAKEDNASRTYYNSNLRKELQNWETNEYPQRKRIIENNSTAVLKTLETEIEALQKDILSLSSKPLHSIITRENIDSIFSVESKNEIGIVEKYAEIKGSDYFDLLKYLIRNGYVDETYSDYMTYFYENSLSRIDKVFLRSVSDKKAKEYTYKLKNPQMVFDRLTVTDFDQEETLNNSLTDYLIHFKKNTEAINHQINQIRESNNYSYVEQFLNCTEFKKDAICLINMKWPELFYEVVCGAKMSQKSIREFSIHLLYYSDESSLIAVNKENVLTDYISFMDDYLAIDNPIINLLISGFTTLSINFHSINYDVSNKSLFCAVYEAGNYELNIQNILLILTKVFNIQNDEDLRHRIGTFVFQQPQSSLFRKAQEDMSSFIRIIISNCEGSISDNETTVLDILNCETVSLEIKTAYLDLLQTQIIDLTSVNDKNLWTNLIDKNLVSFCENNTIEYYLFKNEFDNTIIEFINNGSRLLDFSTVDDRYIKNKRVLFDGFVQCNTLNDNQYERIVVSFGERYSSFDVCNLSDTKLLVLIKNLIIEMNMDCLEFIRENYKTVLKEFIEYNIDTYLDLIDDGSFSQEELLLVLSMKISDTKKLKLLEYSHEPISILNETYSNRIKKEILTSHFSSKDLPVLYRSYSHLENYIKDFLFNYASDHVEDIIRKPYATDVILMQKLIKSKGIELASRIDLLVTNLSNISKDEIQSYLIDVDKEEFMKVFDTKSRPHFENSPLNRVLLQGFKDKGWISEYYLDGNYYKIRRTMQNRKK